MKTLNSYINEKLHINNTTKIEYMYHPKDKNELVECIINKIKKEGLGTKEKPLDLNDIDTSKITDMSHLFDPNYYHIIEDISNSGHFDISDWDVSNVENMIEMFANSHFKGNISKWDVSKVKDMTWMFAWSKFNGDISDWNVNNVRNMEDMFAKSPLEKNPPKWYHESN